MDTVLATVACSVAIAGGAERLVRGRDPRWALAPLAVAVAAWIWLWTLRLPPTPASALLAFTIADVGVLVVGVLGVLRLLGGFESSSPPGRDDGGEADGEDDLAPVKPCGPPPSIRRRLPRHHVPPRNRRRQDHRRRRSTEV